MALGMEGSARCALGTVNNDRRLCVCGVSTQHLLVARRPLYLRLKAQENAKPRADPKTTAVKISGSATRQLLRNVWSMIIILLKRELKRCGVASSGRSVV